MSFAVALRALLRQDPDVIMIGEIRDSETANMAVQASLTGHLVLSTMHTNDATSAVTRMTNMGVEPFLVAASLRAVLAQRLVRKICAACRKPDQPSGAARDRLRELGFDTDRLFVGTGCTDCRETGYSGRIGIFEFVRVVDELRDLVVAGTELQTLRRAVRAAGFKSLLADGTAKAAEGITSAEEILRVTE